MQIIELENGQACGRQPCAAALGFFDGVHRGHARVLRAAAAEGLRTVVVTFHTRPGYGAPLILSPELKERALGSLGADAVAYLDFDAVRDYSPERFVEEILIDSLRVRTAVCGFNYRFGRGASAGPRELASLCARFGARAVTVPEVDKNGLAVSSTRIRSLLAEGRVEEAGQLMGRPFSLRLPVEHGRRLGHVLGFPTINQRPPAWQLLPQFGVYATRTLLEDGTSRPSVTNVGIKPTVGVTEPLSETYILGYEGDLYDRTVEVEFLRFIRREERFSDLKELKEQMMLDCRASLSLRTVWEKTSETR